MSIPKINSLLHLADNALILGHRLSEWCGHGPVLEQDIAITNISLDHLGQARNFYQYASELINELNLEDRKSLFSSVALNEKETYTEDDLAFLRDAWDFKNVLLTEQPNQDWAYTIVRSFFYDHFNHLLYGEILKFSSDDNLKGIVQKSLKEVEYHKRWSSEWVIRLGDGTAESQEKVQKAIDDLWPFTGELFEPFLSEPVDLQQLSNNWNTEVSAILDEATLQQPEPGMWMQSGGKKGIHSEHLGFLLAEMQYMQRAYPGMEW